ncbi:MAG: tetratricopeptide repeat protein [bacterium]
MDKDQQPEKKENKFVISPEIERHIQILRKDPKSPVFAVLSEAYRKGGLLDEAISVATEGLKHNPNYVSGRVALARAYFDKGELDKAEEEFKRVVKSTPDNIISHKLLADIYVKRANVNAAIQELKTVLFLSPDDKEAKNLLNTLSKPAEPHEDKQSALSSKENVSPSAQEPIVKESQITEKEKESEVKQEAPQAEEKPVKIQEEQPEQIFQLEAQPVSEEKEQTEQQTQPAEAEKEEKEEGITAEPVQKATPPVDMELENVLEQPLIDVTEQHTEEPQPQEETQQVSQPVKEALEVNVSEEQRETVIIETGIQEEPQKEQKEEELEFAFEELVKATDTSSKEQGKPIPAEQPAEKSEEQKVPETNEVEKELTEIFEAPQEIVSAPVPQEPVVPEGKHRAELQEEDIQTVTMADLYVKQGHLEKAYHIYRTILQKTPDNPIIRAKLIKVKKLIEARQQDELDKQKFEALKEREPKVSVEEQSDIMKENMKRLSAWLEKIKKGG